MDVVDERDMDGNDSNILVLKLLGVDYCFCQLSHMYKYY